LRFHAAGIRLVRRTVAHNETSSRRLNPAGAEAPAAAARPPAGRLISPLFAALPAMRRQKKSTAY